VPSMAHHHAPGAMRHSCIFFIFVLFIFFIFILNRFHAQKEMYLLLDKFAVESIEFASLANCFYVLCSSMSSERFHSLFRILEAIDYFYTKELHDAVLLQTDTIALFTKNFACAFGVFRALQSSISGHTTIKNLCLIPFLSIIFMRTNTKCNELSDHIQRKIYSALFHSMDSFKVAGCLAVFALESNELQLMTEYRKTLYRADAFMMDTQYSRYPTKKYDNFISRLTTRISSAKSDLSHHVSETNFRTTFRSFMSRKFDEQVRAC
jgi:hypothetical protein